MCKLRVTNRTLQIKIKKDKKNKTPDWEKKNKKSEADTGGLHLPFPTLPRSQWATRSLGLLRMAESHRCRADRARRRDTPARYLLQRTAYQSCTFLTPSLKYRLEVGEGYGRGSKPLLKYLGWIRLSMSMFSWVCLQVLPPHVCTRFANIYSVFLVMEWTRGTSKSRGVALSPLPHSDHKGSHFLCWGMGSGWWEVRRFLWRRFYRLRFFCDFFFLP